ncbi:hypothetical protein GCM10022237_31220 [Nocardioides ginsengisoli]|uniref:PT domain-containing protein n=1 Tax=Nocardioides ginsengisoli TaxID=363868 RepID=A0ABW3VV74_9ACTN
MSSIKRPLAVAGAAVLLGLSLSACGGGDGPKDASVKDFCNAVNGEADSAAFLEAYGKKDYDKLAELVKKQGERAAKVGTPKGIPDDARQGFEISIDAAKDVNGDDIKKAFEDGDNADTFGTKISKDDEKKVKAFGEYQAKTCADSTPTELPTDLPSGLPTDLPTNLPSGLPTDLPSGFPTELPSDLSSLLSNLPTDLASQ